MNNCSENMSRFASTSKTTAAFALTAGRYTRATLEGSYSLFSLGQGRTGGASRRYSGARLTPIGEGADNSTFDYRVFVAFIEKPPADSSTEGEVLNVQYFGGGTATLSTATGVSGSSLLSTSERVADTVTWTLGSSSTTPKGVGETIETARGQGRASQAWSPADNSEAFVDVPEFGGAAYLIIDFDLTGATAANMLIEKMDS